MQQLHGTRRIVFMYESYIHHRYKYHINKLVDPEDDQ